MSGMDLLVGNSNIVLLNLNQLIYNSNITAPHRDIVCHWLKKTLHNPENTSGYYQLTKLSPQLKFHTLLLLSIWQQQRQITLYCSLFLRKLRRRFDLFIYVFMYFCWVCRNETPTFTWNYDLSHSGESCRFVPSFTLHVLQPMDQFNVFILFKCYMEHIRFHPSTTKLAFLGGGVSSYTM